MDFSHFLSRWVFPFVFFTPPIVSEYCMASPFSSSFSRPWDKISLFTSSRPSVCRFVFSYQLVDTCSGAQYMVIHEHVCFLCLSSWPCDCYVRTLRVNFFLSLVSAVVREFVFIVSSLFLWLDCLLLLSSVSSFSRKEREMRLSLAQWKRMAGSIIFRLFLIFVLLSFFPIDFFVLTASSPPLSRPYNLVFQEHLFHTHTTSSSESLFITLELYHRAS